MDIIGTLSLILNLTWIANFLLIASGGTSLSTLRAARVAKVGARTGRLVKIIKHFNPTINNVKDGSSVNVISKQLGLIISQRVALLIMIVVIMMQFLSPSLNNVDAGLLVPFDEVAKVDAFEAREWEVAMHQVQFLYRSSSKMNDGKLMLIRISNISASNCPSYAPKVGIEFKSGVNYCTFQFRYGDSASAVRSENMISTKSCHLPEFSYACDHLTFVEAIFDITDVVVNDAWTSISIISMVIFLLVGFTAAFDIAVNDLMVIPLSRIIDKIRTSAEIILSSARCYADCEDDPNDGTDQLSETDMLEILLGKFSRVIQKSFGNRIDEIVNENGSVDATTSAWLTDYVASSMSPASGRAYSGTKIILVPAAQTMPSILKEVLVSTHLVDSFVLDMLSMNSSEQMYIIQHILSKSSKKFQKDALCSTVIDTFICKVRDGYLEEPRYHNWYHGCDVMHTVYRMLEESFASSYMSSQEIFCLLVASLAHDIGHLGVNNNFLIRSKHELALLHNDRSPLENMHAMKLFEILRDPAANILMHSSEPQWLECRKQILTCILNTDMTFHFDHLKKLETFEEVHGKQVSEFIQSAALGEQTPVPEFLLDPVQRSTLHDAYIHAADLSNPVKPFYMYEKWVERVTDEFFAQGDEEKKRGVPISPMCDRSSTDITCMQLGFIDFVISPLYMALFKMFPKNGFRILARNLQLNYRSYAEKKIAESPADSERLHGSIRKLDQKLLSCAFTESFILAPPK
jgi:hypothetical protein